MKKSLIAMSVAAICAAPMAANAAGTVYGQLQAEISQIEAGAADATIGMVDNARGRIGFKGSEEVGNGMTMIGKMEFKVDTADGTAGNADESLTKREMMVGLKQGWGTFTMGRLKSPYKYTGGVKYDPFVATTLESRGVTMSGKVGTGKAMGHNGFQSDSIGLGLMGGKLGITIGVEEFSNQSDISIGYKHKMGKKNEIVFAHVAQGSDQGDYTGTKVGGKFGAIKFQVEATDTGTASDTNLFVSFGMKAAGGKVILQGGTATGDSYEDDVVDLTAGYVKKFSKKARWFAGLRSTTGTKAAATPVDGDLDNTTVTYGMRFDY